MFDCFFFSRQMEVVSETTTERKTVKKKSLGSGGEQTSTVVKTKKTKKSKKSDEKENISVVSFHWNAPSFSIFRLALRKCSFICTIYSLSITFNFFVRNEYSKCCTFILPSENHVKNMFHYYTP